MITWLSEICLTTLMALFWNFPLFWNSPLMICNFPLLFSHSKDIWLPTLITIIITYYLLIIIIIIITNSHNNYCSVGVTELCLLNLLILIDCFLCNSYSCVLFESLSHVINQIFLDNMVIWGLTCCLETFSICPQTSNRNVLKIVNRLM